VRRGAPLILFDLDGTLLTFEGPGLGPGRAALALAMRDLFGIADATEGIRLEGATDMGVVATMLERAGQTPSSDAIARVLGHYVEHLSRQLRTRTYRPIGAVATTVATLRGAGVLVGLGTGNVLEGARLKLRAAGLEDLFDLDLGGYGGDSAVRSEILAIAVSRCDAAPGTPVVVVGDTRHDVSAARAIGAKAVGVATTRDAFVELSRAGADHIVEACNDELVRYVLNA
jgi:phosphoglycolate phosphatase-like HAD superfamily hydrolase